MVRGAAQSLNEHLYIAILQVCDLRSTKDDHAIFKCAVTCNNRLRCTPQRNESTVVSAERTAVDGGYSIKDGN